jgi:hypothetical protein
LKIAAGRRSSEASSRPVLTVTMEFRDEKSAGSEGGAEMRSRRRILDSLESVYRDAFRKAEEASDAEGMARLDFDYQREQLRMEVLLDLRELLLPKEEEPEGETSLLDRAEALRRIARLR